MEPSMATIRECLAVVSDPANGLDLRLTALARMVAMAADDHATFGIDYEYGNCWPHEPGDGQRATPTTNP